MMKPKVIIPRYDFCVRFSARERKLAVSENRKELKFAKQNGKSVEVGRRISDFLSFTFGLADSMRNVLRRILRLDSGQQILRFRENCSQGRVFSLCVSSYTSTNNCRFSQTFFIQLLLEHMNPEVLPSILNKFSIASKIKNSAYVLFIIFFSANTSNAS